MNCLGSYLDEFRLFGLYLVYLSLYLVVFSVEEIVSRIMDAWTRVQRADTCKTYSQNPEKKGANSLGVFIRYL
jgi:hypothetical protein